MVGAVYAYGNDVTPTRLGPPCTDVLSGSNRPGHRSPAIFLAENKISKIKKLKEVNFMKIIMKLPWDICVKGQQSN